MEFRVENRLNPASQYGQVIEWKRRKHLRSLHFTNQHFPLPGLVHRSPWPLSVIQKLTPAVVTQEIIGCFNPQLNHRSVPGIGGESERESFKRSPSQTNSQLNSYLSRKVLDSHQDTYIGYEIEREISAKNEVSENTMSVGRYVQLYNLMEGRNSKPRSREKGKEQPPQKHSQKVSKPWSKTNTSNKQNHGYFPTPTHTQQSDNPVKHS